MCRRAVWVGGILAVNGPGTRIGPVPLLGGGRDVKVASGSAIPTVGRWGFGHPATYVPVCVVLLFGSVGLRAVGGVRGSVMCKKASADRGFVAWYVSRVGKVTAGECGAFTGRMIYFDGYVVTLGSIGTCYFVVYNLRTVAGLISAYSVVDYAIITGPTTTLATMLPGVLDGVFIPY